MSEKNPTPQPPQTYQEKIKNFADEELNYRLREYYKLYNDTRKKYSFKFSNNPEGNDAFLDVFFNKLKTIFLEDPEIQQKFFNNLLEALLSSSKPTFAVPHADLMLKRLRKKVNNRGYPDKIRKLLCDHYFRRINMLKQKKFKTMQRYSNFCRESQKISYSEYYINERMKIIDEELEILEQKYKRLKHDDHFSYSISHPINKNIMQPPTASQAYEIPSDFDSSVSAIAKNDVICYMRDLIYNRKCVRLIKKISYNIKWIHYSKRFEIYREANDRTNGIREANEDAYKKIIETNKNYLYSLLKEKNKFDQGWNYFVQEFFYIKDDNSLPHALTKIDYPPMIDSCKIEVSKSLENLSKIFKLDFSESTNMQAFLYKVENIFKIVFENQNELSNYFDTTAPDDVFSVAYLQSQKKPKTNSEDVYTMDKIAIEQEKLKNHLQSKGLIKSENINYKIQPSSWLNELVFHRTPDIFELNTMQIMDSMKFRDSFLKNVLDIIDIKDITHIRKFLIQKADEQVKCGKRKIFNLILNFKYMGKSKKEIIEKFIAKLADNNENDKTKDLLYQIEFSYIENKLRNRTSNLRRRDEYIEELCQIYDEEVANQYNSFKNIYQMQILGIRANKRKLLLMLNYMRSIQRKLTLDLFQIRKLNQKLLILYEDFTLESNKFFRDKADDFQTDLKNPDKPKDDERKTGYKHTQPNKSFYSLGKNLYNQTQSKDSDTNKAEDLESLIYRMDQFLYSMNANVDEDNFTDIDDVYVVDDNGNNIIYDCAFKDLQKIEAEFMKIGSYYIDKFEKLPRAQNASEQDSFLLVDRMKVAFDLYEVELAYQFAKARVIEEYFEIFENIYDPLEQYKLIDLILGIMEQRPVLDHDGFYFKDSYLNEIKILKRKAKLLKILKLMQIKEEIKENKGFYESAMKLTEMHSSYEAFKQYVDDLLNIMKTREKEFKPDILSSDIHHKKKNEEFMIEKDVEDIFEEIKKGSTENGKPIKEADGLKEFVHENGSYTRNHMGGPHALLALTSLNFVKYFPNGIATCLLDFYPSLIHVTRILPLIEQVCEDYLKSFVTTDIIQRSSIMLTIYDRILKDLHSFDAYTQIENIESSLIADDVGSLEYAVQLTHKAVNNDKIEPEYLYKLDINYVISRIYSKQIINFKLDKEEHPTVGLPFQRHKEMFLYCNMVEFHRLREELIFGLYETKILEKIYLAQRRFAKAGEDRYSMYFRHGLNFPTKSSSNAGFNIGEGSAIDLPLKAGEFDDMLKAHYNFMSPKSLSYLIIKDELEGFRAALRYELVNKEIFILQIMFNQILLDYPGKLGIEIDLLLSQNPYIVPNCSLDLSRVYAGNENIFNLKTKLRDVILIQKEKMQDIVDWKKKGRADCEKLYKQYEQIATGQELEEIKSKRCRIFRRVLINAYLDDLMIKLMSEANKLTLIDVSRKIKDFTNILPAGPKMIFGSRKNPFFDLDNVLYEDQKKFTGNLVSEDLKVSLFDEKGLIDNLFYIYTEPEILALEITEVHFERYEKITNFDVKNYRIEEMMPFSPEEKQSELYEKDDYIKRSEEEEAIVKKYMRKMINYTPNMIFNHIYLDMKGLQIYKIVLYYNYVFELLNKRLIIMLMELNDEEIMIISSLLYLNKSFPDHSDPKIVDPVNNTNNVNQLDQNKEESKIGEDQQEDFANLVSQLILIPYQKLLKQAFTDVLMEQTSYKHMQVCMSGVREYFKEFQERVKTEYKMMDMNNLLKYLRRETKFENCRLELVIKNLMEDIANQNPKTQFVQIATKILALINSDINFNKLGLEYNYIVHCAREKIHPYDLEKDPYTEGSNFNKFYSHVKKRYNDEINTKLRIIMNLNAPKIKKFLLRSESAQFKRIQIIDKIYPHFCVKNVKFWDSSIYGTSNIILKPNIFHLMSLIRKLDQRERIGAGSSIRQKDVNLKDYAFYKTKKRELNALDFHKPLIINLNFYNQLGTLPSVLRFWQRMEDCPTEGQRYIDSIEEIREVALKDVDIVRAKIRYYQRNQVVLEIPKKYMPLFSQIDKIISTKITPQDLTMFSETEMQLAHNTAEHICYLNMLEKSFIRDALLVIGEENSAMTQFFHKYEEDSLKISLGKKIETNQYFCSTLVSKPKIKTNTINMVNEIHNKVYMVQSFINRLRNRASKVNLLHSGVGYVIAASDLDECLAKLTKYIFDKSLMENINRDESYNLAKSHLKSQLEAKTLEVQTLKTKLEYLQENLEKLADTMLYHKGNSLIFEMDAIVRDVHQVKNVISKLEEKLREKIFKEVQDKIDALKLELLIKDQKFKDFRLEVASFVKTELKIGSNNISKVMNKRIAAALDLPMPDVEIKPKLDQIERDNAEEIYLTTILVTKLRTFYKIKEGLMKEKYELKINDLEQKMQNYNEVYENLVETKKREFLLKKELLSVQRSLAYQEKMNQELKGKIQQLNYDRLRLERYKDSRGKKVEKLEEEIKELKIIQNLDVLKLLDDYKKKEYDIDQLKKNASKFENYKQELEKLSDIKLKIQKQDLAKEIKAKQRVLDKLNEIQREMSPNRLTDTDTSRFDDTNLEEEILEIRKKHEELTLLNKALNQENLKLKDDLNALNQKLLEAKTSRSTQQSSSHNNINSYAQIINANKVPSLKARSKHLFRDNTPPPRFLPELQRRPTEERILDNTMYESSRGSKPNKNFSMFYGNQESGLNRTYLGPSK